MVYFYIPWGASKFELFSFFADCQFYYQYNPKTVVINETTDFCAVSTVFAYNLYFFVLVK